MAIITLPASNILQTVTHQIEAHKRNGKKKVAGMNESCLFSSGILTHWKHREVSHFEITPAQETAVKCVKSISEYLVSAPGGGSILQKAVKKMDKPDKNRFSFNTAELASSDRLASREVKDIDRKKVETLPTTVELNGDQPITLGTLHILLQALTDYSKNMSQFGQTNLSIQFVQLPFGYTDIAINEGAHLARRSKSVIKADLSASAKTNPSFELTIEALLKVINTALSGIKNRHAQSKPFEITEHGIFVGSKHQPWLFSTHETLIRSHPQHSKAKQCAKLITNFLLSVPDGKKRLETAMQGLNDKDISKCIDSQGDFWLQPYHCLSLGRFQELCKAAAKIAPTTVIYFKTAANGDTEVTLDKNPLHLAMSHTQGATSAPLTHSAATQASRVTPADQSVRPKVKIQQRSTDESKEKPQKPLQTPAARSPKSKEKKPPTRKPTQQSEF